MNSNFQNKLQQFSANPPEGVWNKIANALDTDEGFAQRLYTYEETPPTITWQKIEQGLETQAEPVKVVPISKRFSKPMRYVAAASVLAITLLTVILTRKGTDAVSSDRQGTTVAPAVNVPVSVATSQSADNQPAGTTLQPSTNNKNESLAGSRSKAASASNSRRLNTTTPINVSVNDYVTYNDGNGKVVKVSRKMENFINCDDGDWQCKQRLQKLRQKMAAKAMTTDFTGILEMLRQLQ
ncbi:MAG: hypothetical protein M3Q06_07555 [Bacteroidota bacterium]|nr:hypothetical protein [Bacteroidota bacterium]